MKAAATRMACLALSGAFLVTTACGDDAEKVAVTHTITDLVVADDQFDTLQTAVTTAGLAAILAGPGPFTVFAPTDDAFAKLPAGTLDALLADPTKLADILKYHVVAGKVDAAQVVTLTKATTLEGKDIAIEVKDGGVVLNGSVKVTTTDIQADNGIIHVIDAVLLPPEAPATNTIVDVVVGNPDFSTLESAVVAADLAGTLAGPGPFTVFAPTDDAFAKLPAGTLDALLADPTKLADILKYHVVAGKIDAAQVVTLTKATTLEGKDIAIEVKDGGVVLNGSVKVTTTDIQADNGIIHVIDAVLLPPEAATNTIADIVVGNPDFSTLKTAVVAANLAETLAGPGPFTVFAPTDAAFAKLPAGTLDALLADKAKLVDILTYHALAGKVDAAQVVALTHATALNGADITIEVKDGSVILNGSVKVTMTDIQADNGIVHVIDGVLLPPPTIAEAVATNPTFSTLKTALEAAELDTVLAGAGPFTVFAPTNAAFALIPEADLTALLADKDALSDVLLYHVISGKLLASDVVAADYLTTENGGIVPVTTAGGAKIGGVMISQTDLVVRNGVIHVIDAVLLPPPTIAEIAGANPAFETLTAAVGAAGLGGALDGEVLFTVFAPDDDAFAKVPSADLTALLADKPALTDVLLYHALDGVVPAHVAITLTTAAAKNGKSLALAYDADTKVLTINGATVKQADIWARNGIVHVIDSVLLPAN